MHCVKNMFFINGSGLCMHAYVGAPGSYSDWRIFKLTDIYQNDHKYFQLGDQNVMLYDRALSPYNWHNRIITPYKRYVQIIICTLNTQL